MVRQLKFIHIVVFSFLFCLSTHTQGKTIVVVGAVHYPPYYDFSQNEENPSGFLAKHIQQSLKNAGYKVKWSRIPLARGAKALNNGTINVYGSYAPIPGDKAKVVYSPTRLIKMQPIICGLKGNLKDPSVLSDRDVFGQETLFPQGAYLHPKIQRLKLKISRLDYTGDYITRAIKMIEKKRASYFILPESFRIRPYLKRIKKLKCSNFIEPIAMHLSFAPDGPWKDKITPLIKEYPANIKID